MNKINRNFTKWYEMLRLQFYVMWFEPGWISFAIVVFHIIHKKHMCLGNAVKIYKFQNLKKNTCLLAKTLQS